MRYFAKLQERRTEELQRCESGAGNKFETKVDKWEIHILIADTMIGGEQKHAGYLVQAKMYEVSASCGVVNVRLRWDGLEDWEKLLGHSRCVAEPDLYLNLDVKISTRIYQVRSGKDIHVLEY